MVQDFEMVQAVMGDVGHNEGGNPSGNLEEEKLKSLGCCNFSIHVNDMEGKKLVAFDRKLNDYI